MAMPLLKRDWTVDDLLDLPDDDGIRYEIIGGELFMSPAPSLPHQAAVGELYHILKEYVGRQGIGYTFSSPADIEFSPNTLVQPDVFAVPPINGRRPKDWREIKQLLVAAVA